MKKNRTCKYCGHRLSKWNENNYCFVHMTKGYDLKQKAKFEKIMEASRKQCTQRREERLERMKKKFAKLGMIIFICMVFTSCKQTLTIRNQYGVTEYPVDWNTSADCYENIDPVTNMAFSCCCYDEMQDRSIIDKIHRCGH